MLRYWHSYYFMKKYSHPNYYLHCTLYWLKFHEATLRHGPFQKSNHTVIPVDWNDLMTGSFALVFLCNFYFKKRTGSLCDLISKACSDSGDEKPQRVLAGLISTSWKGRASPAVTDLLRPLRANNVVHYSPPTAAPLNQCDDWLLKKGWHTMLN